VLLPREFFTTSGHGSTFTMPHLLILMTMRHASLHVLLQGWRLTKECPLVFFYIAGGIFGKSETGGSLTQYKGMSCRSRYQQRRRSSCIVKLSVEFPISFKCLCFFSCLCFLCSLYVLFISWSLDPVFGWLQVLGVCKVSSVQSRFQEIAGSAVDTCKSIRAGCC
jgi:hypothetical protein